jgi:hypothetical protein
MWDYQDSQEVGLEAAILERVRNSSLVKWSCADNVTGLSSAPKPWVQPTLMAWMSSRGAFRMRRRLTVRTAGAYGSENAGMSSVKHVRIMFAVSLRFPTEGCSTSG